MSGTTHTRTDIRGEGLKRWPFLGWRATADSIDASGAYLVDVSEFDHSGYESDEFQNYYINRYNLSGNDEVKRASTLLNTAGKLYHDSTTAWADVSDVAYELLGVHPKVLNDGIATAIQKMYSTTNVLITRGTDMDMETSGVNWWDGTSGDSATSNLTPTKTTTSANVYSGTQALLLTASGANAYDRSQRLTVTPGLSMYTGVVARPTTATSTITLKIYDVTHGAYLSGDSYITGMEYGYIDRVDTVPAGCFQVQVELRLTAATDVVAVDSVTGPWQQGMRRIDLPSWLNEAYKIRYLKPSYFHSSMPNSSRAWDAYSRYWTGDWQNPQDFSVETFHREVHPYSINLAGDRELPQFPVWIAAERSLADTEPVTTETGTTSAPFEEVMSYVMYEWAAALSGLRPDDPRYGKLRDEYRIKESVETLARPPQAMATPRGLRNLRA
jgi:hypothetical protein